jgi:4-hydroxyacetophenone monooxygenase
VDGTEYDVDYIVMATGFRVQDFLLPMKVRGRNGVTLEDLWAKDGPRAYLGTMLPGFPNLFMIYGPNTNPGPSGLNLAAHHEIVVRFALQCVEELILSGKGAVDVTRDAFERFNDSLDRNEAKKVYRDPRAHNYYVRDGRSPTQNSHDARLYWHWLRQPSGNVRQLRPALQEKSTVIRPYFGEDLVID